MWHRRLHLLWGLVREAAKSWSDDFAPSMGAALSYYTVFSIAPLLLIVVGIAGFVFGNEAARESVMSQVSALVGEEGARAVRSLFEAAHRPATSTLATVTGTVTLLIGATTVFGELQNALDRIWRVPARTKPSGLWALVRARLLSFGLILAIGFLLVISLLISAAISTMGALWSPWFGSWELLAQIANAALGFVVITIAFALIYRYMPRVHVQWHDVWIGAAATSVLFNLGKLLIGLYLGRSSTASVFGAAASFAVLLLWVYYAAQVFLFGAEFTWVYARTLGSMRTPERSSGDPVRQATVGDRYVGP